METKVLFSLFFLASLTGSYGLSLNIPVPDSVIKAIAPHATECNADYGALFQRVLCPLIGSLIGGMADPLPIGNLSLSNLTAISPSLKGYINLTDAEVAGIHGITIGSCSITTPTADSPLMVVVDDIIIADLNVTASYELEAMLASIVPLYGAGDFFLNLGATLKVETDITICPYENPFHMARFDYELVLTKTLNIELTGLLDGAEFIQEIIRKLEQADSFIALEAQIHPAICGALPGIVNPILINFSGCTFLGC